jgi:hypothetical protein
MMTQIRGWPAILGATNFRIRTEIADDDHLVDATCHDTLRVTRCDDCPTIDLNDEWAIRALIGALDS